MWIFNQVKLLRCRGSCRYCYVILLIHPCLLVCAVYVAHCPYVSMGIVALWVNYRQLYNLKISF
jgi:hypothetical protein